TPATADLQTLRTCVRLLGSRRRLVPRNGETGRGKRASAGSPKPPLALYSPDGAHCSSAQLRALLAPDLPVSCSTRRAAKEYFGSISSAAATAAYAWSTILIRE